MLKLAAPKAGPHPPFGHGLALSDIQNCILFLMLIGTLSIDTARSILGSTVSQPMHHHV